MRVCIRVWTIVLLQFPVEKKGKKTAVSLFLQDLKSQTFKASGFMDIVSVDRTASGVNIVSHTGTAGVPFTSRKYCFQAAYFLSFVFVLLLFLFFLFSFPSSLFCLFTWFCCCCYFCLQKVLKRKKNL